MHNSCYTNSQILGKVSRLKQTRIFVISFFKYNYTYILRIFSNILSFSGRAVVSAPLQRQWQVVDNGALTTECAEATAAAAGNLE